MYIFRQKEVTTKHALLYVVGTGGKNMMLHSTIDLATL